MDQTEYKAIRLLQRCSFYPASRDKYWMKNLVRRAEYKPHEPLTAFQQTKLWYLVHRYRRQHRRCPCLQCLGRSGENPYQGNLFSEQEMR